MIKQLLLSQREWIYFIAFELDDGSWDLHAVFAQKDCLFGGGKLTKNSISISIVFLFWIWFQTWFSFTFFNSKFWLG